MIFQCGTIDEEIAFVSKLIAGYKAYEERAIKATASFEFDIFNTSIQPKLCVFSDDLRCACYGVQVLSASRSIAMHSSKDSSRACFD